MDVARLFIRTFCAANINGSFKIRVNGLVFRLKMVEDMQGPLRILSEGKVEIPELESMTELESIPKEEGDEIDVIEVPGLVVGDEEIEEGEFSLSGKHNDGTNFINMDKMVSFEAVPLPSNTFCHVIQESIVSREHMDIAIKIVVESAFKDIKTRLCFPNPFHVAGKLVGYLGDSSSAVMDHFDPFVRNVGLRGERPKMWLIFFVQSL